MERECQEVFSSFFWNFLPVRRPGELSHIKVRKPVKRKKKERKENREVSEMEGAVGFAPT
jgi:hypothetical protein